MSDRTADVTLDRNGLSPANQQPDHVATVSDSQAQRLIPCQIAAALSVLRQEMFNSRSSPANRIRAAHVLVEYASRTKAIEAEKAQLAYWESLDPEEAALKSLTLNELSILQEMTMHRDEGTKLSIRERTVARKFAARLQDIQDRKTSYLRRK